MRYIVILAAGLIVSVSAFFRSAPVLADDDTVSPEVMYGREIAGKERLIIGRDVLTQAKGESLEELAAKQVNWMRLYNYPAGGLRRSCGDNQSGPVWYLMDPGLETVRVPSAYNCDIPEGKYVLVPILWQSEWISGADGSSPQCRAEQSRLENMYKDNDDTIISTVLEVDDRVLLDIRPFRVTPKKCPIYPGGPGDPGAQAYALIGYWVILPPFPKGHHSIKIIYAGGVNGNRDKGHYQIDVR